MGENDSFRILDAFVDAGGTFIDTANTYSYWIDGCNGGESEKLIGKWLASRKRKGVKIATKAGFPYPGAGGGLSCNEIIRECERSLLRLGIDCIDVYYAHVDDYETPIEETLEAFSLLRNQGKINVIGASNFYAWRIEESRQIAKKNSLPEYCCIQQRLSYLRPSPGGRFTPQLVADEELLEYCRRKPVTLLAYSPLLKGWYLDANKVLAHQYDRTDAEVRLAVLDEYATMYDVSRAQIVLGWLINSRPSIIPVIGVSTVDQLYENISSINVNFTDSSIFEISNACTGGTAW